MMLLSTEKKNIRILDDCAEKICKQRQMEMVTVILTSQSESHQTAVGAKDIYPPWPRTRRTATVISPTVFFFLYENKI